MSLKKPTTIEDFYRRAMGAWRGRVSEECMSADLKALALAVAEEAAQPVSEVRARIERLRP